MINNPSKPTPKTDIRLKEIHDKPSKLVKFVQFVAKDKKTFPYKVHVNKELRKRLKKGAKKAWKSK